MVNNWIAGKPDKPISTPMCYNCAYFRGAESGKCDAFPDQIPERIWLGKLRHDKPLPGDHGTRFQPKDFSEFLSISELAKIFGVSPKTIYRAVWSKKLPAYKIGRTLRIAKRDIEYLKK